MPFVANDTQASVDKTQTLTDKILSRFSDPATEPIGGVRQRAIRSVVDPIGNLPAIALSAAGIPEEKTAPLAFGTLGTVAGAQVGVPNIGLGVGIGVGNLVEQSIQKLRGTGEDINVGDALVLGGAAMAGGKTLDVIFKSLGMSINLIPERARAAFFAKVRQAVEVGGKSLGREWRRAVDTVTQANPNKTVDLSSSMGLLRKQFEAIDDSIVPQLKTAVKRSPKLVKAISEPGGAKNLTLKEAQDLKNAITSTTRAIVKRSQKGQTVSNERIVFELLDDIDDKITGQFPEMLGIRQAYHKGKQDFELARPLVERGKAIESSVFSQPRGLFGLGGTRFFGSTEGKLAFEDIAVRTIPGRKIFKAAELAHRLNRIADGIGRFSQIAIGTAVGKKIFGHVRDED